jgi:hypothetical protein
MNEVDDTYWCAVGDEEVADDQDESRRHDSRICVFSVTESFLLGSLWHEVPSSSCGQLLLAAVELGSFKRNTEGVATWQGDVLALFAPSRRPSWRTPRFTSSGLLSTVHGSTRHTSQGE